MATKVRTAHAQNRGVARFLKNDRDKTIGGGLELLAIRWPVAGVPIRFRLNVPHAPVFSSTKSSNKVLELK